MHTIRPARNRVLFTVDQSDFHLLPDSPFVYWIDADTIRRFDTGRSFEPTVGTVRVGLQTGDDPRFVRAVWEVASHDTLFCYYPSSGESNCNFDDPIVQAYFQRRNFGKPHWAFHIKSGTSQPWYSPVTLKLNFANEGAELRNFRTDAGKPKSALRSVSYYYRPGFSWTLRAVRFYPYTVPSGCIPSVSRYMAFPEHGLHAQVVGICGSRLASSFLRFYAEFWQRPKFLVDTLKMLPWTEVSAQDNSRFEAVVADEVDRRRRAYQNHEPFHEFLIPAKVRDFSQGGQALAFDPAALLDEETERLVARSFGFSDEQARKVDLDLLEAIAYQRGTGQEVEANPEEDSETEQEDNSDFVLDYNDKAIEEAHLSYLLGCVYGRWDIRLAGNPDLAAKLPDPFAPLPVCPPGTLVDPIGLPAERGQIVSEQWLRARPDAGTLPPVGSVAQPTATDEEYPIPITWNGILVDDPGFDDAQEHQDDIVRRVRLALEALWKDRAHEVEQNACRKLEFANLREYFRKPSGFFQDHLARYTKSKRKAPIYWPLSTESGKYTIWIYYPRLTDQTLFLCVNEYIDPKLLDIQGDLDRLKTAGSADRKLRQQVDDLVELQLELKALRAKLLEIAQLPYRPVRDDGVLISAAPLWPLFRYRPWQTELRKCWQLLSDGKYDWSHMAHNIWPQRVNEACRKDKSIAIAHGLENLYEEKEIKKARGRRR